MFKAGFYCGWFSGCKLPTAARAADGNVLFRRDAAGESDLDANSWFTWAIEAGYRAFRSCLKSTAAARISWAVGAPA
jgi:hypothetical protein